MPEPIKKFDQWMIFNESGGAMAYTNVITDHEYLSWDSLWRTWREAHLKPSAKTLAEFTKKLKARGYTVRCVTCTVEEK